MTAAPRALRDPAERTRRRTLLDLPHMAPLRDFAASLRVPGLEVPDFDPLDGGTGARLLFVLEKPGPATSRNHPRGSGFVSRDNDDATAEATFRFMRQAKIDRRETLIWNVVPRWNGTTKVTAAEVAEGCVRLGQLLELLPQLAAAVAVGRRAERALPLLRAARLATSASAHPSGQVRAAFPDRWAAIPARWAEAAAALASQPVYRVASSPAVLVACAPAVARRGQS